MERHGLDVNSTCLLRKFTENYFEKLCLREIQFQLSGGRFLDLLQVLRYNKTQ